MSVRSKPRKVTKKALRKKKAYSNHLFPKEKRFFEYILNKYTIYLGLGVAAIGLGYTYFISDYMTLEQIEVKGGSLTEVQEVYEMTQSYLDDRRYFILPQKKAFLFNTEDLQQSIVQKYPEFNIDIRKSTDVVYVNLVHKEGAMRVIHDSRTYLVSEGGKVLFELPEDDYFANEQDATTTLSFHVDGTQMPLIYDNTERTFSIDDLAYTAGFVEKIGKIESILNDLLSEEKFLYYELENQASKDVILYHINGWKIFIRLTEGDSLEKQLIRLALIFKEKLSELNPQDVEYIDLRAGEKVYIKAIELEEK
jgi:cell division septal protein FtsQ